MAKPAPRATPAKARSGTSLFRPGLLAAAGGLFWAAAHQPANFTPIGAIILLMHAVTAALLVRAALACAEPAARLLVTWLRGVLPRRDPP